MNLTLQDFTNMALDDYYDCCIWDNRKEENVFIGIIGDIPEELLNENFFFMGNSRRKNINEHRLNIQ